MWNEELQFFSGYQLEGKKQLKQVKVLCKNAYVTYSKVNLVNSTNRSSMCCYFLLNPECQLNIFNYHSPTE